MKFIFASCLLLTQLFTAAQVLHSDELYKKIENYYLENPSSVEWAEYIHKNALGYDTLHSKLVYIHWDNFFLLSGIDSSNLITGGLLYADKYYFVRSNAITKIKIKDSDLPHTIFPQLNYFPTYNFKKLEKAFGTIKSYNKSKDYYQVLTSKYLLKIDTLTYRINSLHRYDMFEGKIQYDEYRFIPLTDSQQNYLLQQANDLAEASKNFSVTTFKEEEKARIPVSSHEGKTFAFQQSRFF